MVQKMFRGGRDGVEGWREVTRSITLTKNKQLDQIGARQQVVACGGGKEGGEGKWGADTTRTRQRRAAGSLCFYSDWGGECSSFRTRAAPSREK